MDNNEIGTEEKIVRAAYGIFLLYGYHGSTLQQIAEKAGVNKSSVHYYFRSKEKLYGIIVGLITDFILGAEFDFSANRDRVEKSTWFLSTELYNNRYQFEHTLKGLYPDDWESKLQDLYNWLELLNSPVTNASHSSVLE